MDKESLNILLEVQSNSRRIEELNQKIKEENKRIHFVEGNRQKALKEIDEHEVNLNKILIESKKLDKEISQIETLIKRSSNNLDYAVNEIQANAAQKELDDLNTKLGQLESDQLDKWECDLLHLSLICHLPATTDSDSDSDMSDDCVGKLFWIEIMAP